MQFNKNTRVLISAFLFGALMTISQSVFAKKNGHDVQIRVKHIKTFEKLSESLQRQDFDAAEALLDKLDNDKKLNRKERFYVTNFRASICLAQKKLECAITQYQLLQSDTSLPNSQRNQFLRVLARAHLLDKNYSETLRYMTLYGDTVGEYRSEDHILFGQAYLQIGQLDEAISSWHAAKALADTELQVIDPNLVFLLIAIHKQRDELDKALAFIDNMPDINPTTKYKLRVAKAYGELGMTEKMQSIQQRLIDSKLAGYKDGELIVWQTEGQILPLYYPAPIYPHRAVKRKLEGHVDLLVDIDAMGKTQNIRVVESSHKKTFNKAAIRAVEQYRYTPFIKDGVPAVYKDLQIRVSFKLGSS